MGGLVCIDINIHITMILIGETFGFLKSFMCVHYVSQDDKKNSLYIFRNDFTDDEFLMSEEMLFDIMTHLGSQMYVWHGCKWSFAGPQIYLQPAKMKSQHFGVSLKFLIWN